MTTNQARRRPELHLVRRPSRRPPPTPPASLGSGRAPVLRHLPSGRTVLDTGAILIGSRYEPTNHAARQISADAVRVQAALTAKLKPRWTTDDYVGWFCLAVLAVLVVAVYCGWLG